MVEMERGQRIQLDACTWDACVIVCLEQQHTDTHTHTKHTRGEWVEASDDGVAQTPRLAASRMD